MGNIFSVGLFRQMLRSATPVALAGMGGLMTEHAGIMNIGMDGMILMGAFTAVAVSVTTGSVVLAVLAAMLVGILVGLFFALFVVKFQSDEFIIGTALNILADGLTVFCCGRCSVSAVHCGRSMAFPMWTWASSARFPSWERSCPVILFSSM